MSVDKFINLAKVAVKNYTNQLRDNCSDIGINDVIVVWQCKTLQNHKALLITNLFDGMYFEVTYNGDKHEIYFGGSVDIRLHLFHRFDDRGYFFFSTI